MTPEQIWVLASLVGLVALLVSEVLPAGVTGLLAILSIALGNALLDTPVLSPDLVFSGLIDKAVVAVAAMFAISAAVQRTGAVGLVTGFLMRDRALDSRRHYVGVLLFVMVASAFLNNTPLVLIFMPVVLGVAERMKQAPSKVLMPLSFISIMGGMCTLVGTSTNVIVASAVERESQGATSIGMFDFLPAGAVLAAGGVLYLFIAGPRMLPERASLALGAAKGLAAEYMTELEILEGSRLVGKSLSEAFATKGDQKPVRVLQLIRNDVINPALPDRRIAAGDVLLVKGDPAALVQYGRPGDVGLMPGVNVADEAPSERGRRVSLTLVELVVMPGCRWIGRRVAEVRFRERYSVSVFALQRHGTHLREKVEDLRLREGDILLVQGTPERIRGLEASDNFLVVEGIQKGIPHTARAPVALAGLLVFIAIAVPAPSQVHFAAVAAALVMIVGGAITASEAYRSMDWDVLFLLGGTLALGRAFSETGLAVMAADAVVGAVGGFGLTATVAGIFVFTAAITQVLSNNAAAAIMTPLAWEAGRTFPGLDSPMPLVMAVAFGASCCFLTPVGYKTNLLVYGPGGYRFTDFIRFGLPLTVLFAILATLVLPVVYG